MHSIGAIIECVNQYYEMHMIEHTHKLRQENHMFYLPKIGQSDKLERPVFSAQPKNRNIWFGKPNYLVFLDISY
jgi:hypothetical protein